jgi:hypothetical protein
MLPQFFRGVLALTLALVVSAAAFAQAVALPAGPTAPPAPSVARADDDPILEELAPPKPGSPAQPLLPAAPLHLVWRPLLGWLLGLRW